jgi:hypothetical protein
MTTTTTRALPTVGRIVHFYIDRWEDNYTGPYAAIIVFVSDMKQMSLDPEEDGMPLVNICAFSDFEGSYSMRAVEFSKVPKAGCWSWPPPAPMQVVNVQVVELSKEKESKESKEEP